MATTTIRIDDQLKARVAAAAARAGKSPHAFIVEALARTVEQVEEEDELARLALTRWANIVESGKTVPWDDARTYIEALSRGKRRRKPAARKPRAR